MERAFIMHERTLSQVDFHQAMQELFGCCNRALEIGLKDKGHYNSLAVDEALRRAQGWLSVAANANKAITRDFIAADKIDAAQAKGETLKPNEPINPMVSLLSGLLLGLLSREGREYLKIVEFTADGAPAGFEVLLASGLRLGVRVEVLEQPPEPELLENQ